MNIIKRTLSVIFAAVLAFSVIGLSVSADEPLPANASYVAGDADGDAIINSADALRVIHHSSGYYNITDVVRRTAADVTADGNLNSTDALYILYYSINKIDSFPRKDYRLSTIAGNITYDPYTGCVIDSEGLGLVGFAYDAKYGVFYATGAGWQRTMGYTELYDRLAAIAFMPLDTIRIKFDYAGMQWMVQLWKGYYGLVLAGCETGFYNRPGDTPENHTTYNVVSEEYHQEMTCKFHFGLSSFNRYSKTWWLTGFAPAVQNPANPGPSIQQMRVENTINFTDIGLMNAFIEGLEGVDHIFQNYDGRTRPFFFTRGSNYKVTGSSVWFEWK